MHWCGVPALRRFIRIGILLDHQNFSQHRICPRNILLVTSFIRALDVNMIHVVDFRSCHIIFVRIAIPHSNIHIPPGEVPSHIQVARVSITTIILLLHIQVTRVFVTTRIILVGHCLTIKFVKLIHLIRIICVPVVAAGNLFLVIFIIHVYLFFYVRIFTAVKAVVINLLVIPINVSIVIGDIVELIIISLCYWLWCSVISTAGAVVVIVILVRRWLQRNSIPATSHPIETLFAHSSSAAVVATAVLLVCFATDHHASSSSFFLPAAHNQRICVHAAAENVALGTDRFEHIKTIFLCNRLHVLHKHTHVIKA
mmetsp:Transcript_22936/g.39196  ORF Transcript_22936/g.39196 Transcript_22936/m.39196 type:complete len:312 (-) Transcript_22936:1125-2060(-)